MELWTGTLSWWKCHCPIWRVLASSDGISSWTPLKPQHSIPCWLSVQLWCSDFLTPPTPLIIHHIQPTFLESLMSLKNWCSIHARWSKSSLKYSIRFCGIFPSLKQNFIAYRSSNVSSRPDCIFEIHQLWQSGFSRVYSNSCCSCSFESEIIKIGQSSHIMDSNNILNFQESTTILNAYTKKSVNLLMNPVYIYIYIYIYIYNIYIYIYLGGTYGLMVWFLGNGLISYFIFAFPIALIPMGKVWIQLFSSGYGQIVGRPWLFNLSTC